MTDLFAEIASLKARENATILAHYYQDGEIQELADFTGDSLKLARAATTVQTRTIVFCGVHFMAETAKMLNPDKRVLLPDLQAGCSLADSCPAPQLARYQEMLRINGRRFQTVTYINSTAAVKALSDWVVTSGNAEEIIRRVPEDYEILFVPDRHLGSYLEEVTGRQDDPLGRLLHGPRGLQRPRPARPEEDAAGGADARAPGMPGEHPRAQRLRRRHRGDAPATSASPTSPPISSSPPRRTCSGSCRASSRSIAITRCPASPAPATSARTWPETRSKSSATASRKATPEIGWQPEFDRAREVLQRSLLN